MSSLPTADELAEPDFDIGGCCVRLISVGRPSICHVERSAAQSRHLVSQTTHPSIAARPLDCARGDKSTCLAQDVVARRMVNSGELIWRGARRWGIIILRAM